MGGVVGRAAAAVTTMGTSELIRKKPFQPGGNDSFKSNLLAGLGGAYAGPVAAKVGTMRDSPPVPDAVAPATTGTAAVQQVVSEMAQQRSRARGYRATMLSSNFMPSDSAALKNTYGS